jgi:hypothetical protein
VSRLFFDTMKRLTPALRSGDLAAVEKGAIEQMRSLPSSPFHIALDLSITNWPREAAQHFDEFFAAEASRFSLAAAYTEMNGFDINPDRWFCDLFAYSKDGGTDDWDWISDWQSGRFPEYEVNGLEDLQEVYASSAFRDGEYQEASYMCSLLVVITFQRFMERASREMKLLQFPLYVTAHDFDFIAAVRPNV